MDHRIWLLALVLIVAGCGGDGPTVPAPIGDRAALERLAEHYEEISAQLPVSPPGLQAKGRKEFVERVFEASGYQYAATLHRMAEGGWDTNDQNARDLAQLLMLPHHGMTAEENIDDVYSPEELESMRKLQGMLR